jgi:Tol biopolymer transport system component
LIVRDLQTGADTALTSNRSTDVKGTWALQRPFWFLTGDRLVYATGGVEAMAKVVEQRLDGAAAPRVLAEGMWASISHDGRTLFVIEDVRAQGHLSKRAMAQDGSVGPAERLVPDLDVDDFAPTPDGKAGAITFHGDGGRQEIALIALDGSGRLRVTTDGGSQPQFSADGRTLYFLVDEPPVNGRRVRRLVRVPVTSTTPPQIGKRAWVFGSSGKDGPNVSQYSIARDGRLLVAVEDTVIRQSRTVLVQNWPELVAGR